LSAPRYIWSTGRKRVPNSTTQLVVGAAAKDRALYDRVCIKRYASLGLNLLGIFINNR
jgi:hypothetical protein